MRLQDALPGKVRRLAKLWRRRLRRWPPTGWVWFGGLRRLRPVSDVFGADRGQCIDRYYIEGFLADHSADVRGDVLEVGGDEYTRRFGADRVARSHVLHVEEGHPRSTIVADLGHRGSLPREAYDCIICTQTLQFIYAVRTAVTTLHDALKPGGVLLATMSGITQISRYDMERWGDYWRFTSLSARRLLEEVFVPDSVKVENYGNVLAAIAFLMGLSADELRQPELDHRDPDYEVVIAARARKATEHP